jgi:hypothetical protein
MVSAVCGLTTPGLWKDVAEKNQIHLKPRKIKPLNSAHSSDNSPKGVKLSVRTAQQSDGWLHV